MFSYSYINLKVIKINFINTPPYRPHKIQNLHKPINSMMNLRKYNFYMLLKFEETKPS